MLLLRLSIVGLMPIERKRPHDCGSEHLNHTTIADQSRAVAGADQPLIVCSLLHFFQEQRIILHGFAEAEVRPYVNDDVTGVV